MLDSEESASFDEATRHDPELHRAVREMDRLAAAIAVATIPPLTPRPGQVERLHRRLGLNLRKRTNWPAISGWAAAACLAILLVVNRNTSTSVALNRPPSEIRAPEITELTGENPEIAWVEGDATGLTSLPAAESPQLVIQESDGKSQVRIETKRLIQEIEVLRGKLENFQKLDRQRFDATPGMAWPIVMRMAPPETAGGEVASLPPPLADERPITAMLGDALAAASQPPEVPPLELPGVAEVAIPKPVPAAIPIYDAARDTGTLVVSNLPSSTAQESYNLWVTTEEAEEPVYVGRLPESVSQGEDSFDFSLGATGIVPSGFLLTRDQRGEPVAPSGKNTILRGPADPGASQGLQSR